MSKQACELDRIEIEKNHLNDIRLALLSLSQSNLQPQQYQAMLRPLADHMGMMLENIETALSNLDELEGQA